MKMKTYATVVLLLAMVLVGAWFGGLFRFDLTAVTPQEEALLWQECELPNEYGDWRMGDQCFGALPSDDSANHGSQHLGMQDWRLTIGSITYDAALWISLWKEVFVLSKNGWPSHVLAGNFFAHSPNIGLYEIEGKAAWEFADEKNATIIFDGQDLRQTYGLEKAFSPYSVGNQLIFIGQKNGRYLVIYNGQQIGPQFEEVVIAYCCELVLYSAGGKNGAYRFNGMRDGKHYLVQITALER